MSAAFDRDQMLRTLTGATPETRAKADELLQAYLRARDERRSGLAELQPLRAHLVQQLADIDALIARAEDQLAHAEDCVDGMETCLRATSGGFGA